MKIYLIVYGESDIQKAFFDKDKAEKYRDNFNEQINFQNKKYDKCQDCPIKYFDYSNNLRIEDIEHSCQCYCDLFTYSENNEHCKNIVKYHSDYDRARLEEIDVE